MYDHPEDWYRTRARRRTVFYGLAALSAAAAAVVKLAGGSIALAYGLSVIPALALLLSLYDSAELGIGNPVWRGPFVILGVLVATAAPTYLLDSPLVSASLIYVTLTAYFAFASVTFRKVSQDIETYGNLFDMINRRNPRRI